MKNLLKLPILRKDKQQSNSSASSATSSSTTQPTTTKAPQPPQSSKMVSNGKNLQGNLSIVTGASKQNGIGFATAVALAEQGSDIVLHYNSNKDAALKSAAAIEKLGVKVVTVQSDAASASFGTDIISATRAAFPNKTIDAIIANHGIMTMHGSLTEFPLDEFDSVFRINVRSIWLLIAAALPHLTAPGARIVTISSVVAKQGASPVNFYAGSKAALHAMVRGWAEELGPGMTMLAVMPLGPTETDLVVPEEFPLTQKFRAEQYVKRNGTTRELAEVILFLSSPQSSFVTGQIVAADGGMTY